MEEIRQRLKELIVEEIEIDQTPEEIFYQNLLKKINMSKENPFSQTTLEDLFLASLNLHSKTSFELLKIDLSEIFQKKVITKNLTEFIVLAELLSNINQEELKEYLTFDDDINLVKNYFQKLKNIFTRKISPEIIEMVRIIKGSFENWSLNAKLNFLEFAANMTDEEKKVFNFIKLSCMVMKLDSLNYLKEYLINQIKVEVASISHYETTLSKNYKYRRKEQIKLHKLYLNRLRMLENCKEDEYLLLTSEEITLYPIDLLADLEVAILEHNESIFQKLQNKLNILNGSKREQIRKLLSKYKINIADEELLESLMIIPSQEELEQKMQVLSNMKVSLNAENLTKILINISVEMLVFLKDKIARNIISIEGMLSKLSILNDDNYIKIGNCNIDILTKFGLNFIELDDIIFEDSLNLTKKLNLIKCYGLDPKNSLELSTILKDNFFDGVDLWIENGFYSQLNNNLGYLSNNFKQITKKMIICKRMHINPFDEEGKLKTFIREEKKFFMSDTELDYCLGNVTEYFVNPESRMTLENSKRDIIVDNLELDTMYQMDTLTYKIGGQIISRLRVLRNLSCLSLEKTKDAILWGANLGLEECENINNLISNHEFALKRSNLNNTRQED